MKLIIDISEYDREWIKNTYGIPQDIDVAIARAIINGKELPDHHGRLIDENDVMVSQKECGEVSSCQECRMHVSGCSDMEEIIRNAPTIVEAKDSE